MENFKVWDKVVKDIKFYDSELKWRHLDFEIISKIWISDWKIEEINWVSSAIYRRVTMEEKKLYFK